jgi:hypothetical protein
MRELFEEASTPRLLAELIAARRNGTSSAGLASAGPATTATATTATADVDEAEPEPEPAQPAVPASRDPDYATRQELEELARQVRKLSQVQLQLTSQLAALLERTNGQVRP